VATGTELVVVHPDINPTPAAAPVIPESGDERLRFSARSAAILLSLSTVAAGSRISISLLPLCGPPYQLTSEWPIDCAMDGVGFRCRFKVFPVLSLFPYALLCARGHFAQDSNLRDGMRLATEGDFALDGAAKTGKGGIFSGENAIFQPAAPLLPGKGPRRGILPCMLENVPDKIPIVLFVPFP